MVKDGGRKFMKKELKSILGNACKNVEYLYLEEVCNILDNQRKPVT